MDNINPWGGRGKTVAQEYWDDRYRQKAQLWSGNPNALLVAEVAGMAPGRALDLGSGEGGDAVWLAQQGWDVLAVDISPVALARGAAAARAAGVAGHITWEQHDLAESFPSGSFDLVSAQFLHSFLELPRREILYRAARAVKPNGVLLVVGHAEFPLWASHPRPEVHFDSPEEVLEALAVPPDEWTIVRSDSPRREATGPDGQRATFVDSVVKVRRHPTTISDQGSSRSSD
ncbi:MAG: methyltransferase domain-containing protein [Chloroflexota bacterium]